MKKEHVSIKVLAAAAMLSALSIICGKYLAFNVGTFLRFSLENLPIMFASVALGPAVGALTGAVSDLVGCLLVGYEINPLVTLGAVTIGAVSGIVYRLLKKTKLPYAFSIISGVCAAHALGSVLIKTFGLSAYYDIPFYILMLWRLLNYAIIGAAECVLILTLMKNKAVGAAVGSAGGGRNK